MSTYHGVLCVCLAPRGGGGGVWRMLSTWGQTIISGKGQSEHHQSHYRHLGKVLSVSHPSAALQSTQTTQYCCSAQGAMDSIWCRAFNFTKQQQVSVKLQRLHPHDPALLRKNIWWTIVSLALQARAARLGALVAPIPSKSLQCFLTSG